MSRRTIAELALALLAIFTRHEITYLQQDTPISQPGGTNVVESTVRFDFAPWSFVRSTARAYVIKPSDPDIDDAKLAGDATLVRTKFDASVRF